MIVESLMPDGETVRVLDVVFRDDVGGWRTVHVKLLGGPPLEPWWPSSFRAHDGNYPKFALYADALQFLKNYGLPAEKAASALVWEEYISRSAKWLDADSQTKAEYEDMIVSNNKALLNGVTLPPR